MEKRQNSKNTPSQGMVLTRIPPPPKHLNDVAIDFWKKKCADLKAMGRLTSLILESLEAYCNHLADMQKMREMMNKSWGNELYFKYQKAYIEANKQQIVLAREFGFTPLSIKNVPSPEKTKSHIMDGLEDDPLEELRNRK